MGVHNMLCSIERVTLILVFPHEPIRLAAHDDGVNQAAGILLTLMLVKAPTGSGRCCWFAALQMTTTFRATVAM